MACSWDYTLKEYGLIDNKWLCSIIDVKEKWVMVYGRHMFTVDMKSDNAWMISGLKLSSTLPKVASKS